jgi:hypothetical protein
MRKRNVTRLQLYWGKHIRNGRTIFADTLYIYRTSCTYDLKRCANWKTFSAQKTFFSKFLGPSRLWSYGSWIYYYLINQCLSPLTLWVRTLFMPRCTRYNIVSDLQQVGGFLRVLRFPPPIKTDGHNISEILLKVALNTNNHNYDLHPYECWSEL